MGPVVESDPPHATSSTIASEDGRVLFMPSEAPSYVNETVLNSQVWMSALGGANRRRR